MTRIEIIAIKLEPDSVKDAIYVRTLNLKIGPAHAHLRIAFVIICSVRRHRDARASLRIYPNGKGPFAYES